MTNEIHQFGQSSEDLAACLLKKNGYAIIERNYRTKAGEIDIIARHKDTIVFVEVKARRSNAYGSPKYAITAAKKRKLTLSALYYLKHQRKTKAKARFDVVSLVTSGGHVESELITNAFDAVYP
ncbi:MAG: YraN family protein [Desulfobacteraceae bacterium]|nr:YraN family protein [Desulfobacteraceae bacterium]